ncbi:hypothetical protein C491_13227 [Natronococcus amylolyticus DSM 10524]|uniref:Uncharacterized protein n=1 Tax=Natronococcus amylolyticus DSM 10524 TaxID=1227497 RepID=L9X7C4_9EURY|nr:hypothetical protein [Natronococcus amylolyticus]ELY56503.1 hypothetical protein C491_13227 [Natronococcus amylolyticus DSM 10524]
MFGGPDKDREIEPMYQTQDLETVAERAEALETAGARNQRLLAEARAVADPDEIPDDSEIIEVDERQEATS